jgi:phosphatidylglycerophosphate synthase
MPEPSKAARLITISNGLTSLRLLAAPCFYWLIVNQVWGVACLVFWLAVASDAVDGRIARARNEVSTFGGILDHGSDATFVALGHAALAKSGLAPEFLSLLIVMAFVQYALDSRILSGHELRASLIGRWNGVGYFIAPGVLVTRQALGLDFPPDRWILYAGWLLAISTAISMGDRLLAVVLSKRGSLTRH